MSALCPYELEDNVWDEFGESDDHIVPHPSHEYGNQFSGWSDSPKKPNHGTIACISDLHSSNECGYHKKQQLSVQPFFGKDTMLESVPLPKNMKTMAASSTSMSSHCFISSRTDAGDNEFCMDDSIVVDTSGVVVDKENNELLYYGWEDIGNFEDVDGMFRSCDSTFGLGNLSDGEDHCWFSSSPAMDGSEDPSKSSFKFTCSERSPLEGLTQNNEDSEMMNAELPIGSFEKETVSVDDKMIAHGTDPDEYASLCYTEVSGVLKSKSDLGDETIEREQVLSFSSNQEMTLESPLRLSSDNPGGRLSDVQAISAGKLKQATSFASLEKQVSFQKQVLPSEVEIEDHIEAEGVEIVIPGNIDYLNVEENSCVSSPLNEISLEATSFQQLQRVIEELDMRTTLCIRDGLYRLARSAEQRHSYTGPNGKVGEYKEASKILIAQETKRCSGFPYLETETNPIDRSIAHLLFHRPSDSSVMSTNDSLSMMAWPLLIFFINTNRFTHVMADEEVFHEGTGAEIGQRVLLLRDK